MRATDIATRFPIEGADGRSHVRFSQLGQPIEIPISSMSSAEDPQTSPGTTPFDTTEVASDDKLGPLDALN